VGAFVILTNAVEVLVNYGWAPDYWRSLIELGILLLTFGFCAAMFSVNQPHLFSTLAAQPRARPTGPEDDALVERLRSYMEERLAWRDEGLTIASLATQLGEPEYRLRRAINHRLGHRNFAQFVNGYRLAEVKAALADASQRDVPILTIALDAGFGSLGPFNRAFREAEGMTPSEFRARAAG
jgi:AraC-like DNA-binding protein